MPPDEAVYHLRFVPVALSVALGPPTHKFTGVVTVGAAGSAFTFATIAALAVHSQPPDAADKDWLT